MPFLKKRKEKRKYVARPGIEPIARRRFEYMCPLGWGKHDKQTWDKKIMLMHKRTTLNHRYVIKSTFFNMDLR